MRLPGASVSLHRRRLCTNGLCCHLLTLSRLWDHYWYCDLRPYRPQRDIGNNLLNYSTTVLCIYIRPSFHPVSDSHQPSEMETSSRHDCHRFRRLRCQLLFRPTVLLQRPSSQHPWGLHRGRPWQSVLSSTALRPPLFFPPFSCKSPLAWRPAALSSAVSLLPINSHAMSRESQRSATGRRQVRRPILTVWSSTSGIL